MQYSLTTGIACWTERTLDETIDTTIDVDVDELWTKTVTIIPTTRPNISLKQ